MLCSSWQQTTDRLVSTLGKIFSSAHLSYTKILTLLITYITELWRMFCTSEKNCDIACLVYLKLKLIRKVLTLLQKTWKTKPENNSAIPLSSHQLHDQLFHSFSLCSLSFSVSVRHFLNHTIVFLAPHWPGDLGSRLVCPMVAPALVMTYRVKGKETRIRWLRMKFSISPFVSSGILLFGILFLYFAILPRISCNESNVNKGVLLLSQDILL